MCREGNSGAVSGIWYSGTKGRVCSYGGFTCGGWSMLTPTHERNAFLSQLAAAEFALLRSHLAPFDLRAGQCVHYRGDQVDDVLFPLAGLVAMTVPARENGGAAVVLVGREGLIGGL